MSPGTNLSKENMPTGFVSQVQKTNILPHKSCSDEVKELILQENKCEVITTLIKLIVLSAFMPGSSSHPTSHRCLGGGLWETLRRHLWAKEMALKTNFLSCSHLLPTTIKLIDRKIDRHMDR